MKIGEVEIKFKPEFGNETHIRILNLLDRIKKNKVIYEKKIAESKGAKAVLKQINEDRRSAISLITMANEEKNGDKI